MARTRPSASASIYSPSSADSTASTAPTTDRAALLQAIDTLTTGRGTTIGAAILKSVDAIAEFLLSSGVAAAAFNVTATAPTSH